MDCTHTHYCEREGTLVTCKDKYCNAPFVMPACHACQADDQHGLEPVDYFEDDERDYDRACELHDIYFDYYAEGD